MYNIIIEQNKGANNPEERIPCDKKNANKTNKETNKQTKHK